MFAQNAMGKVLFIEKQLLDNYEDMKKRYKYHILFSIYLICTIPVLPIIFITYLFDRISDWISHKYEFVKGEIIRKYKPL